MIQNHWGKWVDSETPITGVIGLNELNIEYITDDMYCRDGINLNYEAALDELVKSFEGKDECEIDRMREDFDEHFEASPDDDWLIGSWVETNDGFYEPDPQGEFSAIVRESVVQVVQSKTIKRVSALCSPCYPGQADLSLDNIVPIDEADHGYLCFSLPDEYFYHEEVQNV